MTTFCPSAFSISEAVTRVTWSVEPPAAHGTMIVMGFVGFHCCAVAAGAIASIRAVAIPVTINVRLLRSMTLLLARRCGWAEKARRLAHSPSPFCSARGGVNRLVN